MGTLLSILFFMLLFCGAFPYWIFMIPVFVYSHFRKQESAQGDEYHLMSTAVFIGAVATITSLSYGVYVAPSQTSCIICANSGGIFRGWPLTWFGRGGSDLAFVPFFLGLDLLTWFLIALIFLSLASAIHHRIRRYQSSIAIAVASIIVILIPFSFLTSPVIKATNWVNQQIDAANKRQRILQQQDLEKRVRRDYDVFNNAIQFESCQDHLVPSPKAKGANDLLVKVAVHVNINNVYYIWADIDNERYSHIHKSLTAGEHELSFLFDDMPPPSINPKPGPYKFSVHLRMIENVNGISFGSSETMLAAQLGLLDETKVNMTCVTQPYEIEDFKMPKGVVPSP